jgi:hypothetical protein
MLIIFYIHSMNYSVAVLTSTAYMVRSVSCMYYLVPVHALIVLDTSYVFTVSSGTCIDCTLLDISNLYTSGCSTIHGDKYDYPVETRYLL